MSAQVGYSVGTNARRSTVRRKQADGISKSSAELGARSLWSWKLVLAFLVAALSCWGFFGGVMSTKVARPGQSEGERPPGPEGEQTLQFALCNGFANQRLALLSGMVLAVELNRTMVLPRFILNGTQATDVTVTELNTGATPFETLFDEGIFVERMAAHGLRVIKKPPPPSVVTVVKLAAMHDPMAALSITHVTRQHVRLDCPIFRVPPELVVKHEELIFSALDALQPAGLVADIITEIDLSLRKLSATQKYNLLHLRTESDWIAHCARWENIGDGVVRDNCMNNTETVGRQLGLHGVDTDVPVMLATDWSQASQSHLQKAIKSLKQNGYRVIVRNEMLSKERLQTPIGREESALIDYYLGLRSYQFIGNSVSTFSAMIILERWQAGRYAAYYNEGNFPLERFLPLYRMPWVFTYNDWSAGTAYDEMVKVAVRSAIYMARMRPFCMYSGSTVSPMYAWLVQQGVTMIRHTPVWRDAFVKEVQRNRKTFVKLHSHLYATDGTVIGTFQRIDIPMLKELDMYNYVLFTDCDVYFRQQMRLTDWGMPLPKAYGMGYEMKDTFPYNAGIALMNIPYLRQTNADFVKWILEQKNGLYFEGYGPLDQGAINQYYEAEMKGHPINKDFNTKPYQAFRRTSRIVHLHGPKPNHYLDWLLTGKCEFGNMCEQGFAYALCDYAMEYDQWNPKWEAATMLHRLCEQGKKSQMQGSAMDAIS